MRMNGCPATQAVSCPLLIGGAPPRRAPSDGAPSGAGPSSASASRDGRCSACPASRYDSKEYVVLCFCVTNIVSSIHPSPIS